MIVWTIQPYEVYQQLMKNGVFYCDPAKSENLEYDNFQLAYKWMIQKMIKKVGLPPEGIRTPIWAWYRSNNFTHKRPDFRRWKGFDDAVCIELDVPEEQVLLSDFEGWHFVLNDWFYSSATSDEEWDKCDKWFDSLNESKKVQVKEKSWQRIFDITPRRGEWIQNGFAVQGCFWEIKKEQVRTAWRLQKGRKFYEIDSLHI